MLQSGTTRPGLLEKLVEKAANSQAFLTMLNLSIKMGSKM